MELVQRTLRLMEFPINQVDESRGIIRAKGDVTSGCLLLPFGIFASTNADIRVSVIPKANGCDVNYRASFPLWAWMPKGAGVSDFERMLKQLERLDQLHSSLLCIGRSCG